MKFIKAIFLLCLPFAVCSCTPLKVKEEVVGTYVARNGDFVIIQENGFTAWSPLSKIRQNPVRVGYLSLDEEGMLGRFYAPDTSPYLSTKFEFSIDYKELNIDWHSRVGDVSHRAVKYKQKIK